MTTKRPTGVLDDAIKAAVRDAICELMPLHMKPLAVEVARELRATSGLGEAIPTAMPAAERFVSMSELCQRLGVNRSTILRRERVSKLPRRRTFPDGRMGWTSGDIDAWFARAASVAANAEGNAALASRITRGTVQ